MLKIRKGNKNTLCVVSEDRFLIDINGEKIHNHTFKKLINFMGVVATIIATILMIFAWCNIDNLEALNEYKKTKENSSKAIDLWKTDLSKVKIGCSERFIEDVIGIPRVVEEINIQGRTYHKSIYINSYFTMICAYDSASTLIGYLLIGNNKSFDISNYRCGYTLFDYSINSAEQFCNNKGVGGVLSCKSSCNYRLDSNTYYFECNLQHSRGATPMYYIGYGVCDIGYISDLNDFYDDADKMTYYDFINKKYEKYRNDSKGDDIRNWPVNSYLIMKYTPDTQELIDDYMVNDCYLGMTRDDYANFQDNYEDSINIFREAFSDGD